MLRRLALLVLACGAFFGALAVPLAAPATADTTNIGTPPGQVARVCVFVRSPTNQGICIHV